MNWLEFFSSIVSALAWPVAIIFLVIVLKPQIKSLISLLQKMKYKDFEMEFGRRVAEVTKEVGVEDGPLADAEPKPEEIQTIELAKVSPRAVITEAWRWVEIASLETAQKMLGDNFKNKTFTFNAIQKLEQNERIDRDAVLLMRDLRRLRNDAVHSSDFSISSEAALDYARLARQLVGYLNTVGGPDIA